MSVRIGVVVFPGTNCDRDTLHALELAGAEAVPLWHEQATLDGVAAVVLPGGFAYGDYLRAGVIARFSPVMRAVAAFAADGGLVLGHLQRLPGPRRGRARARARCCATRPAVRGPGGRDRRGAARHAVHPALLDGGAPLRMPIAHGEGCYFADDATLDALERDGQVLFRYVDAAGAPAGPRRPGEPERLAAGDRRRAQRARQRRRPDAASGARRRRRSSARTTGCGSSARSSRARRERRRRRRPGRPSAAGRAMTVAERPVEPLHRALGVTDDELDAIRDRLGGRDPNDLELAMFSVMWSEHCSYKSSKPLLRTLPTAGEGVVAGPGENAGVISIGDGLAVAFKIESHNHPSAVEPYQGAATGVGGILRDIFTMGARPIAVLDALRFGDPADAADAPPRRRRRARRRRLRQLRRRADGRWRARLRPELRRATRWST